MARLRRSGLAICDGFLCKDISPVYLARLRAGGLPACYTGHGTMHARIALVFAVVLLETFPQAQGPAPAQVNVRGGPAQPGSVLEITVRAGEGLSDPKGTAFRRPLVFLPGPEPRTWRTLVGIDVATPPGPGSFRIHLATPTGRELTNTGTIDVVSRAFVTRRLTVANQFVDPSPAELERIRSEA